MTTTELVTTTSPEIMTSLILHGDLSKMTESQRSQYFAMLCEKLGLNPLTQPFKLIPFQGKLIMYATKDCTEQLRKLHGVSVLEMTKEFNKELQIYIVTCVVQDKHGRKDIATGAVSIKGLSGDALCNAILKSETKGKRRATLSICGLGILDESELDTMGIDTRTEPTKHLHKEDSDTLNKKQAILDEIKACESNEELLSLCKAAKSKYSDSKFYTALTTAYRTRKEALDVEEFRAELGDHPDQRGDCHSEDVPQ